VLKPPTVAHSAAAPAWNHGLPRATGTSRATLRRLDGHHQIGCRGEAHLVAVLGGQIAEPDRHMRLADAGRPQKDDVLSTLDER
jgi:hypothetical protein